MVVKAAGLRVAGDVPHWLFYTTRQSIRRCVAVPTLVGGVLGTWEIVVDSGLGTHAATQEQGPFDSAPRLVAAHLPTPVLEAANHLLRPIVRPRHLQSFQRQAIPLPAVMQMPNGLPQPVQCRLLPKRHPFRRQLRPQLQQARGSIDPAGY